MDDQTHRHHLAAQRDISAMLESTGSDVISWEQQRGPGETDLEAYWRSGNRWLLQVHTPKDAPSEPGELSRMRSRLNGKLWEELTEEEHRRFPGDYEAMVGQGPITLHDEEHLATTDTGIVMLRRLFQRQLDAVAAGRDPVGVVFDESQALIDFEAGNYLE